MDSLCLVIDLQNDFITGPLSSSEAHRAAKNCVDYLRKLEPQMPLILTQDIHSKDYLDTLEGRHLPVEHCQAGSEGAKLIDGLREIIVERRGAATHVIQKPGFGAPELISWIQEHNIKKVLIIGLVTDICVITNALMLRAHFPNLEIFVKSSCMAGTTPKKHKQALEVMKSCQIFDLDELGDEPST